jgi:hypothetical protein
MDWIKGLQSAVPWLAALPPFLKSIISAMLIGAAALLLIVIWAPRPDPAIVAILKDCYRRALFTRMHAQLSWDAMFASVAKCRETVQKQLQDIRDEGLRNTVTELLAVLNQIERGRTANDINKLKLSVLHSFRELARATGRTYTLPDEGKLGQTIYFTQAEADAPLSPGDLDNQQTISPETGAVVLGDR